MFPAGFVQEELDRGIFQRFPEIPCALYELQVPCRKSPGCTSEASLENSSAPLLCNTSATIHFVSAEEYTHASLCLDGSLQQFYSFGRKNSYLMFPAGFVQEELDRGWASPSLQSNTPRQL